MRPQTSDVLTWLEEWNRRVWGDKVALATWNHTLGGVGFGLLIYPAVGRQARLVGYTLIGLSALAHLYAFLTMRPRVGAGGIFESRAS